MDYINKAKEDKLNSFVTIVDSINEGTPFVVKDNISTKDILSTGSSNSLKDYIPFFDATCITKLKDKGYFVLGKTSLDELGVTKDGSNNLTGNILNFNDNKRVSLGGDVNAVSSNIVPFAISSDTDGTLRKSAVYSGLVGYKPTYGLISRYGLFANASSLDTIGVITKSVKEAANITNIIKGQDDNDMTSWDSSKIDLLENLDKDISHKKFFYIKELCDINNYNNPSDEVIKTLDMFKNTIEKFDVEEVSIDKKLLDAIYSANLIISSAEGVSSMSNLTGIIIGPREEGSTIDDIMNNYRTKNFSSLLKERFIIGAYSLHQSNIDKYLYTASKVRALITKKMDELFDKYDAMILPTSLSIAPLFNEELPNYLKKESHLSIANFGGYPSITIPNGLVNNMPVGINITGKIKDDASILNIAYGIENKLKEGK